MLGFFYQKLVRPILFLFEPEAVHQSILALGELLGHWRPVRAVFRQFFAVESASLSQTLAGIKFNNPIGLAAGFDYQARLTQWLPSLGFGFETIGTITYQPCQGNPKPRLGRLPRLNSLVVNKGFRNPGAAAIIKKLEPLEFAFPLGISLGVTNTETIKTLAQGIDDLFSAFKLFEESRVKNFYYELNISCPNLRTSVDFYQPENLNQLLSRLAELKPKKPVWVKMPISVSDQKILALLEVLNRFDFIRGVIFGNLQKDRAKVQLTPAEEKKFPFGSFSGKPTEQRANELIALAYQHYSERFIIVGCGGVFSAQDAYQKIKLGASLVQLITGLVYQGPQLVTEINTGLIKLLQKDGYQQLSEAVGAELS